MFRRARATGRRGVIAASVVALVVAASGYFVSAALAASKPPTPTILTGPANPTTSSSASFTFSDSQSGVTFKCSRDGAAFTTCTSYAGLAQGNHTFAVEAFQGTNASNPATFGWAIVPPTPTIHTTTASLTGATTATFTYTDTQSGVTFKCSLDGSSFSTCSSAGITYNGLGGGSHTFRVEALVGSNPPSVPASFTWTIDKTPPTITLTFPTNGGAYNNARWTNGCSPTTGICGSAADPAGVASVGVALRQQSSGKYWNGSSFSSSSIVFNNTVLATPNATATGWKYTIARPADGSYTLSVRATDRFGNITASNNYATATFTIDTIAPAAPKIIDGPSNPSKDKTPEFEFTNPKTAVAFTCKLDSGALTPCTGDTDHDGDNYGEHNGHNDTSTFGEIQYGTLTPGNHCFSVYATDPAGNVGLTTSFCWTITGTVTATTITVNSGSPQSTVITSAFGSPLVAKVTGAGNVPVAGVSVTFAAPASGASGTFAACSGGNPHPYSCVVTTDATGLATASAFTANNATGTYTVTATATGVATPANFSLSNVNSVPFTISGSVTPALFPGRSQPDPLTIHNPNPSPMTIPINGISITVTTTQAGCLNSDFPVIHGPAVALTVNAGATVTLSGLSISMTNTAINQDHCKGAPLTLTYTGSATG